VFENAVHRPEKYMIDIGSGFGWTSALLSHFVSPGPDGKVSAIERIKEFRDFGENNILKYNFISRGAVEFVCGIDLGLCKAGALRSLFGFGRRGLPAARVIWPAKAALAA